MKFDSAALEIQPLEPDGFEQVLSIAEIAEGAPQWSRVRYEELLPGGNLLPDQAIRTRLALVARDARTREIFGFVIANLVPPEAELESIAVAPAARRRGVGRRLLASLVTSLRAQGITALHLEVRVSNSGAISFYLAQNFKQSGLRPCYYADPEEDAVLMARHL